MKNNKILIWVLYLNVTIAIVFTTLFLSETFEDDTALLRLSFWIWLISTLLLASYIGVLISNNIVFAIRLFKDKNIPELYKNMKNIKFSLIPYFILNFIFYTGFFLLMLGATRGFLLFSPFIYIFIFQGFFTYFIMVGTSIYGILYIFMNYRNKLISAKKLIFHIVSQCFFVFDMISTFIITRDSQLYHKTNSIQ